MKTTDPKRGAEDVIRLIVDEATHGTFDGAGRITRFAQLHDYVDANELLMWVVPVDRITDHELLDAIASEVDQILADRPIVL